MFSIDKSPSNYPENIASLDGVKKFWLQCLAAYDASEENDATIAGYMTGVCNNAKFDEWNSENPVFAEIFELVASLEIPDGTEEIRKSYGEELSY